MSLKRGSIRELLKILEPAFTLDVMFTFEAHSLGSAH